MIQFYPSKVKISPLSEYQREQGVPFKDVILCHRTDPYYFVLEHLAHKLKSCSPSKSYILLRKVYEEENRAWMEKRNKAKKNLRDKISVEVCGDKTNKDLTSTELEDEIEKRFEAE